MKLEADGHKAVPVSKNHLNFVCSFHHAYAL